MTKEFDDYPKYRAAYIRAFQRMIDLYDDDAKRKCHNWKTGEDVFDWWTERWKYECKGQMSLFEDNDGNSFTN